MAPQSGRLTRFRSSDRSKTASRDSAPGGRFAEVAVSSREKPGHSVDVPTLPELAAATGTQSQALTLGEILGEFDHPEAISVDEVGSVVAQSDFGARLITFATLGRNSAWLRALVDLPDDVNWAQGAKWIDGHFLIEVSRLLALGRDDASVSQETLRAVAMRIRTWSGAAAVAPPLDDRYAWGWSKLIPLVTALIPSTQSLAWMDRISEKSWRTREATLEAMPQLVNVADRLGIELDDDLLVRAYVRAAGLEWKTGALVDAAGRAHY